MKYPFQSTVHGQLQAYKLPKLLTKSTQQTSHFSILRSGITWESPYTSHHRKCSEHDQIMHFKQVYNASDTKTLVFHWSTPWSTYPHWSCFHGYCVNFRVNPPIISIWGRFPASIPFWVSSSSIGTHIINFVLICCYKYFFFTHSFDIVLVNYCMTGDFVVRVICIYGVLLLCFRTAKPEYFQQRADSRN